MGGEALHSLVGNPGRGMIGLADNWPQNLVKSRRISSLQPLNAKDEPLPEEEDEKLMRTRGGGSDP